MFHIKTSDDELRYKLQYLRHLIKAMIVPRFFFTNLPFRGRFMLGCVGFETSIKREEE